MKRRPTSSIEPLRFSLHPLFFSAICFACGIFTMHRLWIAPALLSIAILACIALSLLAAYKAQRVACIVLAAVFFLLGGLRYEAAPWPDQQTQLQLLANDGPQTIEGIVNKIEPLRQVESTLPFSSKTRREQSQRLEIKLNAAFSNGIRIPAQGGLSLTIYAPLDASFPDIPCGSMVRLLAELRPVERYLDPGVWNERAYMLDKGIGAFGSAKLENLSLLSTPRHASLSCWLHSLQQKASTRLIAFADAQPTTTHLSFFRLDHSDAAMLTAMLTGDRSYLSRGIRTGFERTGSFHLLVVSGLHLAIFATLIFSLAKLLRMSRVVATLATVILSFAYMLFTGYGQPVQRSFWMITLYLLGRLIWRERNAMNAIGFAALSLLAANPRALFDAGFQMTLLSVLAIAGIAAPVAEKTFAPYLAALRGLSTLPIDTALPPRITQFRVTVRLVVESLQILIGRRLASLFPFALKILLRAIELLLISIIVECVMSLPMALYFHRVTIAALPVNLCIMPLVGLLLPSAIVTLLAVLLWPAAAAIPAAATALFLHAALFVIHAFSVNPFGDIRLPGPAIFALTTWGACIAFSIWVVRQRRIALFATSVSLAAALVVVLLPHSPRYRHGALEITTIDVGQGDSLLVISPEGKTLLVDGGGLAGASPESKFDMGEDVVSQVLWARGIRHLDAVAITHCHADHIGGIPSVLANFHPHELWVGINPASEAYDRILREASLLGVAMKHHTAGDMFRFGSVDIRVLAPEPDYIPRDIPTNNDSLVMRVSYGKTSALLEGDAEAASEAQMVARGGLRSDLLKVGHHGSKTSTTPAFLAAVAPQYAAISAGRHNFYGHPKYETLEKLEASHALTYRTDLLGASTFYLDGTRIVPASWSDTLP